MIEKCVLLLFAILKLHLKGNLLFWIIRLEFLKDFRLHKKKIKEVEVKGIVINLRLQSMHSNGFLFVNFFFFPFL